MEERLLEVKNLCTSFFTDYGEVKAVNDVSFYINRGEVVAIVGESGCGKSVTQLSILQLVQSPPGRIVGGEVIYNGINLLKLSRKKIQKVRGAEIAMIFQEPMTSLNPIFTVGNQIAEVIRTHTRCSKEEAWEMGIEALKSVGIPEPVTRMKNYPFEMSGGMCQRVLIAVAVACKSKLIIADEPTTALDVTTQAQVMELLMDVVKQQLKSLIVVTHNLGLVARYAHRIYVMYAGRVVESGTTEDILTDPQHPYTKGLLQSVPKLEGRKDEDLIPIEGQPPSLAKLPTYCAFAQRCKYMKDVCMKEDAPVLRCVGEREHYSACHLNREGCSNETTENYTEG